MQQLLDKWERLRRSEYLRSDEKLMLNHCISDLKRFMNHSVEANEMVNKQQTAVDYYSKQIGKLTADLVTGRITGKQFVMLEIKLHSEAKEMEKEKLEDSWVEGVKNWNPSKSFEQYYKETYGEK
jgi:hypothetical protein